MIQMLLLWVPWKTTTDTPLCCFLQYPMYNVDYYDSIFYFFLLSSDFESVCLPEQTYSVFGHGVKTIAAWRLFG